MRKVSQQILGRNSLDGAPPVAVVDGVVEVEGIAGMSAAAARELAGALIRAADTAEGAPAAPVGTWATRLRSAAGLLGGSDAQFLSDVADAFTPAWLVSP